MPWILSKSERFEMKDDLYQVLADLEEIYNQKNHTFELIITPNTKILVYNNRDKSVPIATVEYED